MSKTLDLIINSKRGYRTKSFSGSNTRNIEDIIRYELSMGNVDIVTYVQKNYGILKEYYIEEEIEEKGEYWNKFSEMCQENAKEITKEIVDFLKSELRSEEIYGLWLTTYENVEKYYGGIGENIEEYILLEENKFMVLSDLDEEGSLFVF